VKFRVLHAHVFGPLRDRSFAFTDDINLIYGPNESGKSSFRSAMETILYGFDPATREAHPLNQFDSGEEGDLMLEAELAPEHGENVAVERILMAQGKSRTATPGEPFEGPKAGNTPLAQAAETPRHLYRAVYSLSVDDLRALSDKAQNEVDHLLLPQSSGDAVRPTSVVLAELRARAARLWRRDNKGNYKTKLLRKDLSEAKRAKNEASREEERLRAAREEKEALELRREEILARRSVLEELQRVAPFLKRLHDWRHRSAAHAKPVDLKELKGKPLADPTQLSAEIDELEAQMDEPRARLAREKLAFNEDEERLLEAQREICEQLEERGPYMLNKKDWAGMKRRVIELNNRARTELCNIAAERDHPPGEEAAAALPLEALRAERDRWDHALAEAREARPARALEPGVVVLALVGAVLVLFAAFGTLGPVAATGGIALLFVGIWAAWRSPTHATSGPESLNGMQGAVANDLRNFGISETFLQSPVGLQRLIECLHRVQDLHREAVEVGLKIEQMEEIISAREVSWQRISARFNDSLPFSGVECLDVLEDQMQRAEEQREKIRIDESEREAAERLLATITPALERKRKAFTLLHRVLRKNAPDTANLGEAYTALHARLAEEERLRELESELLRDPLYVELEADERAKPAPGERPVWHAEECAQRERELAELVREAEELLGRLGEIRQMLQDDAGSLLARADGRVRRIEEEIAQGHREHDRLALLERIVYRADREYREEHQPDVLRRASEHLTTITDERYSRLEYSEEGELLVSGRVQPDPVPVAEPLSRGTRDQIHLCLRLGLLDHLDEGREPMPLVLDEVLVHWDEDRRRSAYSLFKRIAATRQVFLLTCHEALAAETERALGVLRQDLGPRRQGELFPVAPRPKRSKPRAKAKAARESTPEPTLDLVPAPPPEPESEAEPEATADATSKATADATAEPAPESTPELPQ